MTVKRIVLVALASLLVSLAALAARQSPAPKQATLADLSWMVGGFAQVNGKSRIEEHWIPAAGGSMLAVGRTIVNDKTVFFEFLRLEERPDGIYYIAHPKARPGTEFKLTRSGEREAVFENPQHDNPKILHYQGTEGGGIHVHLEGDENGKHVTEELDYAPIEHE
jgi:hypothetical protein